MPHTELRFECSCWAYTGELASVLVLVQVRIVAAQVLWLTFPPCLPHIGPPIPHSRLNITILFVLACLWVYQQMIAFCALNVGQPCRFLCVTYFLRYD